MRMFAHGVYSATNPEIIDSGRKPKTVFDLGIYWSDQCDLELRSILGSLGSGICTEEGEQISSCWVTIF